jgi:hypothetical protein
MITSVAQILHADGTAAPSALGRVAATAAGHIRAALLAFIERPTLQRKACERALAAHGWIPLVPLSGRLPLATIAWRGSETAGVAVSRAGEWSAAQQGRLLQLCREDGLHSVVVIGRPSPGAPALEGIHFLPDGPSDAATYPMFQPCGNSHAAEGGAQ